MMQIDRVHPLWIGALLLGLLLVWNGCDSDSSINDDGWDLTTYAEANVIPNIGVYEFSATGCFEVTDDPDSGGRIVFYASDCFNYRRMEIVNGTFYGTWGDIDGTHCPEDSFGISGHFKTPQSAAGTIKYAANCTIYESLEFAATQ